MTPRRPPRVWLLLLVVCCIVGGLFVGTAVADHDDTDDDAEIIEVQQVTFEGTDPGVVTVTIGYHLDGKVQDLEVNLVDPSVEVVDTNGFDVVAGSVYEWDESTTYPTITVTREANVSVSPYGGLDYVDGSDWSLVGPVSTNIRFSAVNPDVIDRSVHVTSDDPDTVGGKTIVYRGEYDHETFESSTEQFQLISVPEADPWWDIDRIEAILRASSDMLDVGADDELVTVFVVTDPIRRGGLTSGEAADMWLHEDSLHPGQTTLWHEYVHTRQTDRLNETTRWTHEAEAEYYAYVLAMKQGEIDFHDFYTTFDGAEESHAEAVLSDPHNWTDPRVDYELGALTIAAIDEEIRAETDGQATYEGVLRQKNEYDEEITADVFEDLVVDVAGTSFAAFFDQRVHSRPRSLSVPSPSMYEVEPNGASLSLSVDDVAVEPGDSSRFRFELTNTGTEPSLVPELSFETPETVESVGFAPNHDRGVDTRVTPLAESFVFDTLDPGETVVFEYELSAPEGAAYTTHSVDASAGDLAGNQANSRATLAVMNTPTAALAVPDSVDVGEEVLMNASASTAESPILAYSWEIFSQEAGSFVFVTNDPTTEHTFSEPGEYVISVSVENDLGATDTAERTVVVSDTPVLTVEAPETAEVDETVALNATVTNEFGDYEIYWDVDGQELTGEGIDLTLRGPGEHEIGVRVEDEYGATAIENVTITVGDGDGPDRDGNGGADDVLGPGLSVSTGLVALLIVAICTVLIRRSSRCGE